MAVYRLDQLMLHPRSLASLQEYIVQPCHAMMLVGPAGTGKGTLAETATGRVLSADPEAGIDCMDHPYVRIIQPVDGKAIPIESIRELQHFLSLRVPGPASDSINRAAIIKDAHLLTTEAQNALLKTLEEPPAQTVIVLTASSAEMMLPTIRSRTRVVSLLPPSHDALRTYLSGKGYPSAAIERSLSLSGALPGLATALLQDDDKHPLVAATTHARGILQSKTYDRLLLVDGLSKDKQLCQDILFVLGQMARMALMRSTDAKSAERWRHIMRAVHTASEQFTRNVQAKLVLTNLMLEL
ncbi:MAG TPA: hypothetical protein VF572_01640 [Candidatus Saccharimonadales bacterium]|jgi:DNA polymerase-3 subunit delta'